MRKHLLVALSLLSLSAAGAALAQGRSEGPSPQQQLNQLHEALRLSPQQEPAWRAYVASLAPDPSLQARRRSAAEMMPKLTTPRRVDLINAEMERDMAAMRREGEAVKAFYARLTPQQQGVFDRVTLQPEGEPGR